MLTASLLLSWLAIGGFLLAHSPSRGRIADMTFVATWPIHLLLYLIGRDHP